MNISITTIQEWAGAKEYWYTYNDMIMHSCSVYSKAADEYIESKGKSSMIRVFMLPEDKELLANAHEYAKERTVAFFNDMLKEYPERKGSQLYLADTYLGSYTEDNVFVEGAYTLLSSKQEY